jgi:hypothetical protein
MFDLTLVACAGVPMIETGRDRATGADLGDPAVSGPGEQRVPLEHAHHLGHGVPMRGGDPGLHRCRGQRPQHARGLGHRERQVEPSHRRRCRAAPFLSPNVLDHSRSLVRRQILGQLSHPVRHPLIEGPVHPVAGAESIPAHRVLASPVQASHLLLGNYVPDRQRTCR